MALQRTYLYSSDSAASIQNIYNYLMENAVPEYFDSVSLDETNNAVSCYIGDLEFVRIANAYINPQTQVKFIINTTNHSCESYKGTGGKYICYAFKTPHGISFTTNYSSLTSVFTICKDNDGNTVAMVVSDLNISKSSSEYRTLFTANPQTGVINGKRFFAYDSGLGTTAAVPLYVGDTTNYTPDVLLLAYAQNVSDGILDIGGIRYWSNGLWAVKIDD